MNITRTIISGVATAAAVAAISVAAPSAAADSTEVCSTETYTLNTDRLFVPWDATLNTGVIVPGAAAGQVLKVSSATYTTYDRYQDGQSPNRAEAGQLHESVGVTVGGVQVGSLSKDVPNGVAEGAPTDWYSGAVTGSFGGAGTVVAGGEIVVKHASLYGFSESPNSVRVSQVEVLVSRCSMIEAPMVTSAPDTTEAPVTTEAPATTAAPVTTEAPATTAAPATTEAPVSTDAPATTAAPVVVAVGPAPAPTTAAPATTAAPVVVAVGPAPAPAITTAPAANAGSDADRSTTGTVTVSTTVSTGSAATGGATAGQRLPTTGSNLSGADLGIGFLFCGGLLLIVKGRRARTA